MADVMKNRHCRTSSDACARWMVFDQLGTAAVPVDLFPNQVDRALKLIGAIDRASKMGGR